MTTGSPFGKRRETRDLLSNFMTRNYTRLSIEDFGTALLDSGDLDPIYIALYEALKQNHLDVDTVSRWMIAYWCFYHAGVSSYLAEFSGPEFWEKVAEASMNETPSPVGGRWPRGKERRHFRGLNGMDSVLDLATRYPERPEEFLRAVYNPVAGDVITKVRQHSGFGPWIAWKVADMLERVHRYPITFEGFNLSMYAAPTDAALLLYAERSWAPGTKEEQVNAVVAYLLGRFKARPAPPANDRAINVQEVETILCKWASHMGGHYPLYNDLHEIREGMTSWTDQCATAQVFLQFLPHAPN